MTLEDESLNGNVDNEMSSKNCFRLVILGKKIKGYTYALLLKANT